MLHPGRTLLEKLAHVDSEAQMLKKDVSAAPDRRIGRHFYDVFQLLGDDRVVALLRDRDQTAAIIASIDETTRALRR